MNPYKVLGVNPGDDEETIKKAYRNLVKKYHPDRYVNTPMADMATEKLKEINEAYDMITNKKQSTGTGYGQNYGYGGGYSGGYQSSYQSVRMLIRMGRLAEAEAMLQRIPKTAEWYYLMGLIYINRGWYDKGREYVNTAVSMEPGNMEYRQTLNSFDTQNQNYREFKMEYMDCCMPRTTLGCLCTSLICSRYCYCCC